MKLFQGSLFIIAISFMISCNNNQNKSDEAIAKQREDSIRRADSIKMANEERNEREQYRSYLQARIDSMNEKIRENDEMYAKRTDAERQRWLEHRARLNARVERLQKKKGDIGTVAKDDWGKFKLDVDTAMTNLKTDWNNMLEKMKAK